MLVFTDLDGSLLDHHSYSYRDALPQLHVLDRADIPVIPASSKTRAEIARLRQAQPNRVFVDVNLRSPWWQRDPVIELLQGANWVKLNRDELNQLKKKYLNPYRRARGVAKGG